MRELHPDHFFLTPPIFNVIYGINDELQLWSYDLSKDVFEVLGDMPKHMDSLTYINQTDILLTVRISAKKEVAELILAD